MDSEDVHMLHWRMENEGFDYCFRKYSSFKEIEDEKFHELRKKYIKAAEELENYINGMVDNIEDV